MLKAETLSAGEGSSPPPPLTLRLRKIEFAILLLLTIAAMLFFANGKLDLQLGQLFYHPDRTDNKWWEESLALWEFFYHAAPWLTGFILIPSLGVLVANTYWHKFAAYRMQAIFAFVVIALGPGLLINTIFKPYWGRSRPREVIELGGKHPFQKIYQPDFGGPGRSFPCGHCSVGFSLIIVYWSFRKRNNTIALMGLGASLGLGTLMGIGRMAAGGHFASDIAAAGLMTYWVSYLTFHRLLAMDQAEDTSYFPWNKLSLPNFSSKGKFLGFALMTLITVVILLLASPFHSQIKLSKKFPQKIILITLVQSQVELFFDNSSETNFSITGNAKGFGFPGAKTNFTCKETDEKVECQLAKAGIITDFESSAQIHLNPKDFAAIAINNLKGEVTFGQSLPENILITNHP